MSGPPGGGRRMIRGIIARFREKGATSPERAMTAEELGLPPRFEEAMRRRLGATGIFVEADGKFYLDEAKLKQVQEQRMAWGGGMGGGMAPRSTMLPLRMASTVVGIVVILLIITNILVVRSLYLSLAVVGLLVIWLALNFLRLYYLSRVRRRWRESQRGGSPGPTTQ